LLSEPAIVFLDEPTSGLDPVASREVHELIDGLRERGVTVFLTTHRLEEAERLCHPRCHPQHQSAHDRPTGRAPRPALHEVARRAHRRAARLAGSRVRGRRRRRLAQRRHNRYTLTVSDARIAAPAVTRALVAAGADVLSLAEEQHSLEDVYLELMDDDVEADS